MKLEQTPEGRPPGGDAARRCVWMTAGMVSYRLCDHDFRCDDCPLDAELRHVRAQRPAPAAGPETFAGDGRLLFFAPNHTWVRIDRSDAVFVGLDDFAVRLLSPIRRFILPAKGAHVVRGDSMAIVVQDEHSFIVDSPIGGRAAKVNSELLRHPEVALAEPATKSWLLQFAPSDLFHDLKALLAGPAATAWQQHEAAKLEVILGTCPPEQLSRLGGLMQDGRPRLDGLARLLGPDRYAMIVNSFLHPDL